MKITLTDKEGNTYTINAVASLLNSTFYSVRRAVDTGLLTVEEIAEYIIKNVSTSASERASRTLTKYYVKDHDGKLISATEAADRVNMSPSTVRNYINNHGCRTMEDVEEAANKSKRRVREKKYKTPYGMLTSEEVYNIHPHKKELNIASVRGRLYRRGGMCPSLWWAKMPPMQFRARLLNEGLEDPIINLGGAIPRISGTFTRSKCFIDGPCEYYNKCTDEQIEGIRPVRCKEDRSCYVRREYSWRKGGENMKPRTLVIGGAIIS